MFERIKRWWRHNHSLAWIDIDDNWQAYKTRWQTQYAAGITIVNCQLQRHPKTGEERVKKTHVVGLTKPIELFDSDGFYVENDYEIPPQSGTEAVVNENNESEVDSVVVTIGDDNE